MQVRSKLRSVRNWRRKFKTGGWTFRPGESQAFKRGFTGCGKILELTLDKPAAGNPSEGEAQSK